MTRIAGLMIEMAANVARLRQDMDRAQKIVDRAMKDVRKSVDAVKRSVATLFAGLSAGAFVAKLTSVQREFDVLNSSLVTVTGSTAAAEREFAWIKQFAATTPYQLNEVTSAFVKMKALGLDASQEALNSYGNTASAMGKGLNQMIEAVADAATGEFERLKEFGIKSKSEGDRVTFTFRGVSTEVGKNAAEITKYLRAIGETDFAGAMELRSKTLDGAISNLADTWDELFRTINNNSAGSVIYDTVRLASGALSDAVTIMEALTAATRKNGRETGAMAAIQRGLAIVFETIAVLGVNLRFVLVSIGREIGGIAAQIAALLTGNFSRVAEIRRQMLADAVAARQEVDVQTLAILTARKKAAELSGEPVDSGSGAGSTGGTDTRTRSQKELAAAAREAAKALREQEQAARALADLRARVSEMTDRAADTYFASAEAVMAANAALRDEIALIGLDESARRALLLTTEEQIVADRELLLISYQTAGASRDTLAALEQEIRLRRQRLDLLRQRGMAEEDQERLQKQLEVARKTQAEWDKTWDQVAQSMTDALIGGGVRTKDLLQNMFKTLVLRPAIEPIMKSVAGSVGNLIAGLLPSFDGGGYTGGGARSGGLDGRGGYLAMLHPRETVIDHTKGGGAGGNNINIVINNTIGDVATQSQVVSGMQVVRSQIMGELQRSARYGGAMAA